MSALPLTKTLSSSSDSKTSALVGYRPNYRKAMNHMRTHYKHINGISQFRSICVKLSKNIKSGCSVESVTDIAKMESKLKYTQIARSNKALPNRIGAFVARMSER
jgi:hypothetical protein